MSLADDLIYTIQRAVSAADGLDINQGRLGEFKIFADAYRVFTQSLAVDITAATVQLPFNFSSLSSLFFYFRNDANAGSRTHRWQTVRTSKNILSFSLDVAGKQYPSEEVSGFPSMFSELVKTMHALAHTNFKSRFDRAAYEVNATANADAHGCFVAGLDLQAWSHKSNVIVSGINTLDKMVMLKMGFNPAGNAASQLVSIAHFDVLYKINSSGQMYAVY